LAARCDRGGAVYDRRKEMTMVAMNDALISYGWETGG
jgi:hypothetical protein